MRGVNCEIALDVEVILGVSSTLAWVTSLIYSLLIVCCKFGSVFSIDFSVFVSLTVVWIVIVSMLLSLFFILVVNFLVSLALSFCVIIILESFVFSIFDLRLFPSTFSLVQDVMINKNIK